MAATRTYITKYGKKEGIFTIVDDSYAIFGLFTPWAPPPKYLGKSINVKESDVKQISDTMPG
jgi:hypothetical protein